MKNILIFTLLLIILGGVVLYYEKNNNVVQEEVPDTIITEEDTNVPQEIPSTITEEDENVNTPLAYKDVIVVKNLNKDYYLGGYIIDCGIVNEIISVDNRTKIFNHLKKYYR